MIMREGESSKLWTVAELLSWTERYFGGLGLATPRLDAEVLLATALGCTRVQLYTSYQMVAQPPERIRFRTLIERRGRREPVAYITGKREFFSLSFEVSRAVLVPRPETEHLVELALRELGALEAPAPETGPVDAGPEASKPAARVLDLGTGSGNLAVAIAVNAPAVQVDAVDASGEALALARRNAEAHHVAARAHFFAGDLFAALPVERRRYRVIVSNPPYISRADYDGLMDDVRLYEPPAALLDSKSPSADGLGFYRTLAKQSAPFLESGGLLAVEVGEGKAKAVGEVFAVEGWRVEEIVRDYGGVDRVVALRRCE
jgi:release factor glutamine methyltransferase